MQIRSLLCFLRGIDLTHPLFITGGGGGGGGGGGFASTGSCQLHA